jgi:hypothetical protein
MKVNGSKSITRVFFKKSQYISGTKKKPGGNPGFFKFLMQIMLKENSTL